MLEMVGKPAKFGKKKNLPNGTVECDNVVVVAAVVMVVAVAVAVCVCVCVCVCFGGGGGAVEKADSDYT